MKKIFINFPSITLAIKSHKLFNTNGISSEVVKTPSAFSPCGCGYSVTLDYDLLNQAKLLLNQHSIIYNDISESEDWLYDILW